MIRYQILENDLVARINAQNKTWLTRAKARTLEYTQAKKYTFGTDFWGDIKQVYIDLQHEKCAYCETKLQGCVLASKVHEVEHYRPKSSIKAWATDQHWTWPLGAANDAGYYKLAYHYFNYAIACTRCNSTLKSNYFPIRGVRDIHNADPRKMLGESALLLYPISDLDGDDPEDIITFDGVLAVPKQATGLAYERAATNIEFFQLNHEDLTSRRAQELVNLWIALDSIASGVTSPAHRKMTLRIVDALCSEHSQFASCTRSFRTLFQNSPESAQKIADLLSQTLPK